MIRAILMLAIVTMSTVGFSAERPNVIVLLADDLGAQDLGCYGGPVKTPVIDRIATAGARFSTFYSGCAVCSPSRATLLTGRHHIRAGVYSWIHDASQQSHLLEREVTLAELLIEQGYQTAHFGKWHLGLPTPERDKPTPSDHGFDYWFATWNNAEPSHRNPRNFIRNGTPIGNAEGYACQLVVDEAIQWLDRHRDDEQPFFLNVWFHEPHAKIAAPEDLVTQYGKPKDAAAIYSATIANTDNAIDRLLFKLASISQPENTLIIYASDNGSYREDRTGGLRARKGSNWEGGIRVPGIFAWPGKIKEGVTIDQPAGLVDVLPTVCGLLDIEPPQGVPLDGIDVSDLLTGTAKRVDREQPMFWHLQRSSPIVAMRDGDWSLVAERVGTLPTRNMFEEAWIPQIKNGAYQNFRLFNLADDPGQTVNLADKYPDRVEQLKRKLLEINASVMADGPDWHLN